jgi:hypothetical protein
MAGVRLSHLSQRAAIVTLIILFIVYGMFRTSSESPAAPVSLKLRHRDDLAALCEVRGLTTGAELGIQHGGFAKHNLENWPSCTSYAMVDIWKRQDNYVDLANTDDDEQEKTYQQAMRNVKEFAGKTKVMRMFTSEAAGKIADNSLDFIYVDARHDYCGVMEDLIAWYPKLRIGGIFAGHDYLNADEVKRISADQDWSLCQDGTVNRGAVKGAVQEFAAKIGVTKILQTSETWPSFYWIRE